MIQMEIDASNVSVALVTSAEWATAPTDYTY